MKNKPLGKEKLKKKLWERTKTPHLSKRAISTKKPLAKGKGVKTDKSELNKGIRL